MQHSLLYPVLAGSALMQLESAGLLLWEMGATHCLLC